MGRHNIINVHSIIPCSRVNGPGKRLVVFFQGCSRKCLGCFNPATHSFEENQLYSAEDILKNFLLPDTEGITVSGGEPFLQAKGLLQLLKAAKEEYGLSTVVYTGFNYEELKGYTPPPLNSLPQGEGKTEKPLPNFIDWVEGAKFISSPLRGEGKGGGEHQPVLNHIDVLIDGAYKDEQKEPTLLARGSTNQRLLFLSNRYQEKDFYMPAKVEIIISRDGTIKETGFSRVDIYKAA
ncbi:MAG: radical SAM protein [Nitrospirae bacterium]|nr:radical SAM protein [Nitrospirota bacterium]